MSMQLMNRKSCVPHSMCIVSGQLEFIPLAPAALYPHSFGSFSVVLFGFPAAADLAADLIYNLSFLNR